MVSLAEGFGLNTDPLETNILNLAVVIPLVYYLGKNTLTAILDLRREKILQKLRTADTRFEKAQLELDEALYYLAVAANKAVQIKLDGVKAKEAMQLEQTQRYADIHRRMDAFKTETIRIEEEKVVNAFRQQLIDHAFEKAIIGIRARMNATRHRKYIDAKIALMSKTL